METKKDLHERDENLKSVIDFKYQNFENVEEIIKDKEKYILEVNCVNSI